MVGPTFPRLELGSPIAPRTDCAAGSVVRALHVRTQPNRHANPDGASISVVPERCMVCRHDGPLPDVSTHQASVAGAAVYPDNVHANHLEFIITQRRIIQVAAALISHVSRYCYRDTGNVSRTVNDRHPRPFARLRVSMMPFFGVSLCQHAGVEVLCSSARAGSRHPADRSTGHAHVDNPKGGP